MSACRSKCYGMGNVVTGADALVETLQVAQQATLQCTPCASSANIGGTYVVNGRVFSNEPDQSTQTYWALNAMDQNDGSTTALPYTLAGATFPGTCWIAPFDGTVSDLIVREDIHPSQGVTRTYQVFVSRPDSFSTTATDLTVQFTILSPYVLVDSAHEFAFREGDLLSMGIFTTGLFDAWVATFSVVVTKA